MNFDFTKEQYLLKQSADDLLEREAPIAKVREAYEQPDSVAAALRAPLAQQGFLGLRVPEAYDGSGLNFLDMALVFESAGAHLLPYPLVESYVVADLIDTYGSEEQKKTYLPKIANGEMTVSVAWGDASGARFGYSGVQLVRQGGKLQLVGRRSFVPFARVSQLLLVPVERTDSPLEDRVALALVNPQAAGLTEHGLSSMDGSYPLSALSFESVPIDPEAFLTCGTPGWQRAVTIGRAALSSELVGVAEKALADTVEYMKTREQFNGPIGRFQAIKHIAADDYLMVESGRLAVRYAAWMLDENDPSMPLYVQMAKAYCSQMGKQVTGDAIQLHGGIGFTWENDTQLYFKRAWRSASQLGNEEENREEMAKQLIDGRSA
ncbi:MAG: acyl-CoA/acyl-ACP dehydrogenase [Firmicutes bacterium]|nr:acyl-CoA/acyl-ACP dehydrogenase [Bacillota bacterium]